MSDSDSDDDLLLDTSHKAPVSIHVATLEKIVSSPENIASPQIASPKTRTVAEVAPPSVSEEGDPLSWLASYSQDQEDALVKQLSSSSKQNTPIESAKKESPKKKKQLPKRRKIKLDDR